MFLYNPPENSSYTQSFENDLFELIENDISLFSENSSKVRNEIETKRNQTKRNRSKRN